MLYQTIKTSNKVKSTLINFQYFSHLIRRSRNNILYGGWLGHQNFGDEAVFSGIQSLFWEHRTIFNSDGVDRLLLSDHVKEYCFSDFMIGGGTLINRSKWRFLGNLQNAVRRNKEILVFGTGVANPDFWMGRRDVWQDSSEFWKGILKDASFVGVRGPSSQEILSSWGIPDVKVIGDPVLVYGIEHPSTEEPQKRLGLNCGVTRNVLWGKSDENVIVFFSDLCKYFREKGWEISFFSVFPEDTRFIREVIRRYNPDEPIEVFEAYLHSTEDALKYFEKVDVFLGEKLHSCVAAACTYTPFVTLEYRPKCLDFAKSVGMEAWCMRTDQLNLMDSVSKVEEIYNHCRTYRSHLYSVVAKYKKKLWESTIKILSSKIILLITPLLDAEASSALLDLLIDQEAILKLTSMISM
ncbi:MAG: polysaccharide pyruvyl transferase family protein [Nitrospirae bacterium]|nr:polysaccharide pyruvyl transferase family protein [Nitrospirota bacterium]MBI3805580.1 polysaccharide pyruvyl transferase family protein [Candidatus Manganitrophaceae bacterium]